jgi:hypothetical protein
LKSFLELLQPRIHFLLRLVSLRFLFLSPPLWNNNTNNNLHHVSSP